MVVSSPSLRFLWVLNQNFKLESEFFRLPKSFTSPPPTHPRSIWLTEGNHSMTFFPRSMSRCLNSHLSSTTWKSWCVPACFPGADVWVKWKRVSNHNLGKLHLWTNGTVILGKTSWNLKAKRTWKRCQDPERSVFQAFTFCKCQEVYTYQKRIILMHFGI